MTSVQSELDPKVAATSAEIERMSDDEYLDMLDQISSGPPASKFERDLSIVHRHGPAVIHADAIALISHSQSGDITS